jgi:uncharacterized protein (TIGR02678 family)
MKPSHQKPTDSRSIGQQQRQFQREEFRSAVRALLMTPLMTPMHEDFVAVRRQADALHEWFTRETGWPLQIGRDGARLYKRPADLKNPTRGLPDFDRRRYVLLCLACAVLERADPQVTLRILGERLLGLAAEPELTTLGFTFTLSSHHERRELIAVCRTLLSMGVLQRIAGDEDAFVQGGGDQADALYDVHRPALAGMLAAVRGPSTWPSDEAPATLDQRLHALVDEHVADSDEGRRTALRHRIAREVLDDPAVYVEELTPEARAYFINQRGAMAARLCEATGLVAEQRAEGVALVDQAGTLTDVAMPAEGTDAHVTLLVAEYLAAGYRQRPDAASAPQPFVRPEHDIVNFLSDAKNRYGRYWRKSAREPGAERELAKIALGRLEKLRLVARGAGAIQPLPALARFALGEDEIRQETQGKPTTASLFDPK